MTVSALLSTMMHWLPHRGLGARTFVSVSENRRDRHHRRRSRVNEATRWTATAMCIRHPTEQYCHQRFATTCQCRCSRWRHSRGCGTEYRAILDTDDKFRRAPGRGAQPMPSCAQGAIRHRLTDGRAVINRPPGTLARRSGCVGRLILGLLAREWMPLCASAAVVHGAALEFWAGLLLRICRIMIPGVLRAL